MSVPSVDLLRRQVETIEAANREIGYPVPDQALVCLPYLAARALLDRLIALEALEELQ